MQPVFKAYERNAALILASENWANGYNDAPEQHGKLIKATARLERKLVVFFKDEAARAVAHYVNWYAYSSALQEVKATQITAYDVNVIVNDSDSGNDEFINIVFDEVVLGTALGAQAGQTTYSIPTDLSAADSAIQRQARKQVAQLVGRRVLDDGSVVTNPNPDYVISNTTRKRIQDSIHTSLMLGDDVQTAANRIQKIIKDPKRAMLIAHQEMANAYTSGLHMYGQASGAVGKEWQTNGAIDICAENAHAGPIPFEQAYPSGDQHPTAHIGCKCYERLIYQSELDNDPNLFKHRPPTAAPKPAAPAKPKATKPKPAAAPITKPAPAPPTTAVFTKAGKTTEFELNSVEAKVISENNIKMTTEPSIGKTRWATGTHGMYVEHGLDYKGMHIKNPTDPEAKMTFYHEIGHAIDHNLEPIALTDRYANTSPRAMALQDALKQNTKAIYDQRITEMYVQQGRTEDEINTILNGGVVRYTKEVRGRERRYIASVPPSYRRYASSPSEVFAHGYGYYRTNPEMLQTIAPELYKVYKGLQ